MGQFTGLEHKKILVVEDVELNQFLARHIMESWGCEVHIAANGALAVDLISSFYFDLVLMDIQMPIMDGIQATRTIRAMADPQKATVPIVALTANARHGDFDVYLQAGMNDCVSKPFAEPVLFKTVFKHIRKNKESSMNVSSGHAESADRPAAVKKLYDLSMVEAIAGGDSSFISKMLQLFVDTAPGTIRELKSLCEKKQWQEMSKVAHKLKSTIDSMGIESLKQTIRDIEASGKTGTNIEAVPAMVRSVTEVMDSVMTEIKKDLAA